MFPFFPIFFLLLLMYTLNEQYKNFHIKPSQLVTMISVLLLIVLVTFLFVFLLADNEFDLGTAPIIICIVGIISVSLVLLVQFIIFLRKEIPRKIRERKYVKFIHSGNKSSRRRKAQYI